jgi:hypothetical protein
MPSVDMGPISKSRIVRMLIVLAIAASLVLGSLILWFSDTAKAEDYTFASEDVNKGSTVDPSNKNVEDGDFEQLIEGDQYSDTNFSASSESMTYGTEGGDSFPTSLNSDDGSKRTYTEEDTGSPGSPYIAYLYPDADVLAQWSDYPDEASNYMNIDETTVDSDGDTTYIFSLTTGYEDRYSMADLSDPGSGYTLDVRVFGVHTKKANQPSNVEIGIRIGSTNYQGFSVNPTNGDYVNDTSVSWTTNPATSSEWTYLEVSSLIVYLTTDDADPAPRVSQIGLKVWVNFSGSENYELDGELTFSSVTSSSQTTGYKVFLQAMRSDSEDFYCYAWDYNLEQWNLKDTIDAGSDTDFDFTLTTDERDGTGNEVKLRFLGGTETGDTSQSVLSIDVCKVSRIEVGYALDVEMTATSLPQYGELRLKVKAYTSAEYFDIGIWNFSSSAYDLAKITIDDLSNTLNTYDLLELHHRSSQTVKIQFLDQNAAASDQTKDTCYVDWCILTWVHTDPEGSDSGCNGPKNVGQAVDFWVTVTDADNEVMSYVRVNIGGSDYDMLENNSGDTDTWDSKAFYLSKSDIAGGTHDYYFKFKDANSGEITTSTDQVTINRAPTLAKDGVEPSTGNNGDTFSFYCEFMDLDGDLPSYFKVVIDDIYEYDMVENSSGDTDTTDGKGYYYEKQMSGGSHDYYFKTADYLSSEVSTTEKNLDVNNKPTLSDFTRLPGDPVYPTTQITFKVTYTDLDGEFPSSIKWRENEGSVQNVTMNQEDAGDTDVTDGKVYAILIYLSHGSHDYDFYASDGNSGSTVSGGDNSISIQNRDPVIGNAPGTTTTYRSTYWEWDVDATDPDNDAIDFESWDNCTFELTINGETGLLSGTTDTNLGWYEVWVWANDSYSGSDSYNFQLYVVNRVPSISSSGNTTQQYGTFMSYCIVAEDPDSDELSYEFWSEAPFLSIENNWVNGTANQFGSFLCKVWANDSYGGSDLEQWTLEVDNEAPYFTSTPTYTVQNGSLYEYDADAVDPESQSLTYSSLSNASWMGEVDSETGEISGTADEVGSYWLNITVSDGTNQAFQNFSVQVQNSPPVITTTNPDTTGTVGIPYYFDADATDSNGDDLLWELTQKFSWMFVDSDTGEVQGTPTANGILEIKLRVWDGYSYDWLNWTLTISGGEEPEEPEEPPVVPSETVLRADFSYEVSGKTVTFVSTSTSEAGISKYLWVFGDGSTSASAKVVHRYDKPGFYKVTLTVSDGLGNTASVSKEIEVSLSADDRLRLTSDSFDFYLLGGVWSISIWVMALFFLVGFLLITLGWPFRATILWKICVGWTAFWGAFAFLVLVL